MQSEQALLERFTSLFKKESDAFDYTVKRTRRKSFGIYVFRSGKVEVRVPLRARERDIADFVKNNVDWVNERLAAQAIKQVESDTVYRHGASHYFMGELISLKVNTGPSDVKLKAQVLEIFNWHSDDAGRLEKQVLSWYRNQAKQHYPISVERCLKTLHERGIGREIALPPLAIRRMRTRWGSCSSRGNINLNLWLIRLPIELQDYVISHELCHLIELNHSSRFHALMDAVMPDWRRRKKELNAHPASCLAALEGC